MLTRRSKLLERAENAKRESKLLDFKREFDTTSKSTWCEIVKDIVAFANSGGGIIIFGLNNDGSSSNIDVSKILELDIVDITNKIQSYTSYQFSDVEIIEVDRDGYKFPAIIIADTEIPIIFTRPGTYDVGNGHQKTAFSMGTLYFRHGAKSEPGNLSDLINWRDSTIERIRSSWLGGIRKVVEAPAGHALTVISSPISSQGNISQIGDTAIAGKIRSGSGSVSIVPRNAEEIWPYRQKELLSEINKELKNPLVVNSYDILCINAHLNVLKQHPEFAYKPHKLSSPQYSVEYVRWIISQYKQDPRFFLRMRSGYKK